MTTCTIEGCDRLIVGKGLCNKHYAKSRYVPTVKKTLAENRQKSKKGYVFLRKEANGKRFCIAEHVYVWEQFYGMKKPEGTEIHHINEIKDDNRIDNLELLDRSTHERIHCRWENIDGVWWKHCHHCHELFIVNSDNFYPTKKGYGNLCKTCDNIRRREHYQQNRESVLKKAKEHYLANSDAINFKRRGNRESFQRTKGGV